MEFYIAAWDEVTSPFFDALVAAAARGVTVRLLFDHLASRGIPGYKEFVVRLDASSIDWHPMLPLRPLKGQFQRPDLRNHRKLMVVDGADRLHGLPEPDRSLATTSRRTMRLVGNGWSSSLASRPDCQCAAGDFARTSYIETHERLGDEITPETVTSRRRRHSRRGASSGPGHAH